VLMLLCDICYAKHIPCRGGHEKGPFGRCEICGKSDDRVSCDKKAEPVTRSLISIYRSTVQLQYRRSRKK